MIFMITDAIFTLADRKGSSREAIWKYISSKNTYQESIRDKKLFLTQLKRLSQDEQFFHKSKDNMQRFKLSEKFKEKLRKGLKQGQPMYIAQKSAMTTKVVNPKKPASKMQKAKMSKSTKGKAKLLNDDEKKLSKTKASQSKSKNKKPTNKKDGKKSMKDKAKREKVDKAKISKVKGAAMSKQKKEAKKISAA